MTSDPIGDLFTENYPGSKRKRREQPVEEDTNDQWRDNFIMKRISGEEVPMYTIGALADAVGVSVPTARRWINKGYLPLATFRLPSTMIVRGELTSGRRMYTAAQIDAVVGVMKRHGLLNKGGIDWTDHSDATIEIADEWEQLARSKGAVSE